MSSGFNGLPNIKMEDGGMGSLGLKVKHKTFNISTSDQPCPVMSLLRLTLCDATSGHQVNPIYQFNAVVRRFAVIKGKPGIHTFLPKYS